MWLLCACGVRRFKGLWRVLPFILSNSPANSPFVGLGLFLVLVLRSWLCGLAFGVGWVVVSFSLADSFRHKKRGRNSLRPLFDCYPYSNVLYIFHSFTLVVFSSTKE